MVKHCCGTAIKNVIIKIFISLKKRSYVNLMFNSSLKCNMHCCVKKILSLPINLDENTCLPVILLLEAAVLVSMHLVTRHVGIQMEGKVHYAQLFQISSKNCKLSPLAENNCSEVERIYNPITAMGFSAMFTFQLYNTKR